MPGAGTVPLMSQAGAAAILEVIGGGLLIRRVVSRGRWPSCCQVKWAFAYFIGHARPGFWPILNQGIPAIVLLFRLALTSQRPRGVRGVSMR
jgi:hypothetical protein